MQEESLNNQFFEFIDEPVEEELPTQISVSRYIASKPFDRNKIQAKVNDYQIGERGFGVLEQYPNDEGYIRTLWVQLGSKMQPFVDKSGILYYVHLSRLIKTQGVVEFFNEDKDENTGIIIFGGGQGIQKELLPILETDFGFKRVVPRQLTQEEIRSLYIKYSKLDQVKAVNTNPANDVDWGQAGQALIKGQQGKTLDTNAKNLVSIKNNEKIFIKEFSSYEDIHLQGMRRPCTVYFDLKDSSIVLRPAKFEVESNARLQARQIYYNLARTMYFKLVGKTIGNVAQKIMQQDVQLSYFDDDFLQQS